ncbi:MAG: toll/interleukin-1 receptor domain-containing protein, partial [Anaerolineae bacterium]|nr:toll/interleukin-1 receptor domain-containing protein [Anaerolineae bacterium]
DFANRLRDGLEARGLTTWMDKHNIRIGKQWDVSIEKAIVNSSAFVFVISPDSIKETCIARKELHIAHRAGIDIIPILYRSCRWWSVLLLPDIHHLDYTDPKKPTSDFTTLLDKLCDELGSPAQYLKPSEVTPIDVNQEASDFIKAARLWFEAEVFDNALNRLRYAERLGANDNDLLGEILYLRNRIEALLENRRRTERSAQPETNASEDLTRYGEPGVTDYYGMVRLALVQENNGEHVQAVRNLWRACKIEPRITSKAWMTEVYGLSDEQHMTLEKILIDLPR